MSANLISCANIIIERNGRTILDVPSFHIEEGERLAILGTTGAGKSTFLSVLGMTLRPDAGVLSWRNEAIIHTQPGSAVRRKIAMAFQVPLLFKGTVYDNVSYGLGLRKVDTGTRRKKVAEILDLFKIGALTDSDVRSLSGGEAHRVSLARALIFGPELLLLDEPMASLDPGTKETLIDELIVILKELKVTCVYVTHSREESFIVADRLLVMESGRIAQTGTAEDVFYHPATANIAAFVGTGNILPGKVLSSSAGLGIVELDGAEIEAVTEIKPGTHVDACIRPEEIFLEKGVEGKPTGKASARNRLAGKVSGIEILGPVAQITIDCGISLKALITRRSLDDLGIGPGMEVSAGFKATSVHVIERSDDVKP
jgi:molybdopterin-binding protein